jgi:hypothetical protein
VQHLLADAPALPSEPPVDLELLPGLERQLVVKHADRLDLHAVAAIAPVLHADNAALQRMHALGLERQNPSRCMAGRAT